MPSGAAAKRMLLLAGMVMVALLIAGFVVGAIGSQMFGTPRFLAQPEIHLPPQPVFPFSAVKSSLGYSDYSSDAEHKTEGAESESAAAAEHPPAGESAELSSSGGRRASLYASCSDSGRCHQYLAFGLGSQHSYHPLLCSGCAEAGNGARPLSVGSGKYI